MKAPLFILLAFSLLLTNRSVAQIDDVDDVKKTLEVCNKDTVAWVYGGFLAIGFNEGFLHNWAAGGELASLSVNGIFNGRIDRLFNRNIWSNNLDLSYGLQYNYSTGFVPRKTDDRIDFTSKYGYKITRNDFYFTGLFNFKSQFTKGFDYAVPNWDTMPTSKFMSPAYFTTAIGLEYRKGSDVSLFLSPAAGRLTLVNKEYTLRQPAGAFGVPYGEKHSLQLGAYFSGRYTAHIGNNIIYRTRLDLYSNYLAKDKKDSLGNVVKTDNPGNVDVLFDNLFSWKATKFLSVTLGMTFIYDNDIPYNSTYKDASGEYIPKNEPGKDLGWLQVKQIFTFGLQYKF
jgi:hypothetical protein